MRKIHNVAELEVVTFRRGPFWNFSYLIACRATGRAAVIDPGWDAPAILSAAGDRGLAIETVILTHSHTDHVNALGEVLAATGATVVCHEAEAAVFGRLPSLETVAGTQALQLGEVALSVVPTPGHSPGSVSILAEGRLFSGDTLLVGSVGRPGPGGVEALWESIRALRGLPSGTVIHPGHDEGPAATSSVGEELERVAALSAGSLEEFAAALERATGRSHAHEI